MSWNAVTLSTNNFKLGGNVICSEIHDLNFRMEEKRIWTCQSLSHFYGGGFETWVKGEFDWFKELTK